MSGNAKFRGFLLAPILLVLLVVVIFPAVSWAGELEDAQEAVRQNPDNAPAHYALGTIYRKSGEYLKAITSFKEAVRIKPHIMEGYSALGIVYQQIQQYQNAITY